MMVEIAHRHPGAEQSEQGGAVPVERDVEYRDFVTCYRVDALEQPDIAFDAGDERRISGLAEPELLQSAYAVGVAVECVVAGHLRSSPKRLPMNRRSRGSARMEPAICNSVALMFSRWDQARPLRAGARRSFRRRLPAPKWWCLP